MGFSGRCLAHGASRYTSDPLRREAIDSKNWRRRAIRRLEPVDLVVLNHEGGYDGARRSRPDRIHATPASAAISRGAEWADRE